MFYSNLFFPALLTILAIGCAPLNGMENRIITEFKDYQSYISISPTMSAEEARANLAQIKQDIRTQPLPTSLKLSELVTHTAITPSSPTQTRTPRNSPTKIKNSIEIKERTRQEIESRLCIENALQLPKEYRAIACVNRTFDKYYDCRSKSLPPKQFYRTVEPFIETAIKKLNIKDAILYASTFLVQIVPSKALSEVLNLKNFVNQAADYSFPKPLAYFTIDTLARKRCYAIEAWKNIIRESTIRGEPNLLEPETHNFTTDLSSEQGALYLRYRNIYLFPELIDRGTRYNACVSRTIENIKEDFHKALLTVPIDNEERRSLGMIIPEEKKPEASQTAAKAPNCSVT